MTSLRKSDQLGGNCAGLLVAYQKATRQLVSRSGQLEAAARSGNDSGAFALERGIYPIMARWGESARPLPVGCNLILV